MRESLRVAWGWRLVILAALWAVIFAVCVHNQSIHAFTLVGR